MEARIVTRPEARASRRGSSIVAGCNQRPEIVVEDGPRWRIAFSGGLWQIQRSSFQRSHAQFVHVEVALWFVRRRRSPGALDERSIHAEFGSWPIPQC